MRRGRPYVLVRRAGLPGHDASGPGDTWEPLDNLTNCEDGALARGGIHAADVGAAWHGRLAQAARRRLLRRPLGAAIRYSPDL